VHRMEICCLEFQAHTTGVVHCSRTSFTQAHWTMTSSFILLQLSVQFLKTHHNHQFLTILI